MTTPTPDFPCQLAEDVAHASAFIIVQKLFPQFDADTKTRLYRDFVPELTASLFAYHEALQSTMVVETDLALPFR